MPVLSNSLKSNETIVYEAKVHWATLIVPGLFIFLYGIGLLWFIPAMIRILTTELSLSSKRVVGKTGLIKTTSMDSPLNKLNSVSVESGLFGKIFGYGTIVINTASTVYYFKYIKNANNFKTLVASEIDNYEESRINAQAKILANAMKAQ